MVALRTAWLVHQLVQQNGCAALSGRAGLGLRVNLARVE
jgi:hypothetical protein